MSNDTDARTISEFLLARISEDETFAQAADPGPWFYPGGDLLIEGVGGRKFDGVYAERQGFETPVLATPSVDGWHGAGRFAYNAQHVTTHSPSRVLRECEVKRRLVAPHTPGTMVGGIVDGVVRDLSICPTCAYWVEDDFPAHDGTVAEGDLSEEPYPCLTLRDLAFAHSDHPDFNPAWASQPA